MHRGIQTQVTPTDNECTNVYKIDKQFKDRCRQFYSQIGDRSTRQLRDDNSAGVVKCKNKNKNKTKQKEQRCSEELQIN